MNHQPERLCAPAVTALRTYLRGSTILPEDLQYARARRVWNAAIDRRPAAIVACADAEDVGFALRIAGDHGLPVTVRGGGHNVAGRSVADGALLLDLSHLRNVAVNAEARIATVQGGALWRDVDAVTAEQGLATTGGLVSSTGVGGFTLGGGAGWLMRRHGLASDNLLAAGVVLSDGRFVRASADEHSDLFWGLRGAAGGFGVVTSFEFRLHPLREVLAGLVIHPATQARYALRAFRDFVAGAPDEFCGLVVISSAPPLPFLDPAWHGRPVIMFASCWCGDLAAGERVMAPLRQFGSPLADHMAPMPYVQWQRMQDPNAPAGRFQYWKTANYSTLTDEVIEVLAGAADDLPTPQTEIHVQHMGGEVARIPAADSAFAGRDTQFFVNLMGVTLTLDEFGPGRDRVRRLHDQITPQALHTILPNFSNHDDGDAVRRFDKAHAERINGLRRKYDPSDLLVRS